MTWMEWYDALAKPPWTPGPSIIRLIWWILYPIIAVSFGYVLVQTFRGKVRASVALPFAINLVANLLFMPIFAGLRNVPLSLADILIVWGTIVWCIAVAWPRWRWVGVAQFPYLVWVTIAATIQALIAAMNWGA